MLSKKIIVAVCLLTWTEVCSSQNFKINRRNSRDKDFFTIPSSVCDPRNNNVDLCTTYNAQKDKKNCDCFCSDHSATFTFRNQSWSCLKNINARSLFGCSQGMFFTNEESTDNLEVLKRNSQEQLSSELTWKGNCIANASSSWYIGCQGNAVSFAPKTFEINWDAKESEYTLQIKIPKNDPLTGRVVNLGITCMRTMPGSSTTIEHSCLLFKIEGTTYCPVMVPPTSKGVTIDEIIKSTAAVTESFRSLSTTRPSLEVKAGPSVAADQRGDDVSLSSSVGLIAGVGASLILILILGFFIYRWKYSRNQPHTGHAGQTSQTSHAGQTSQTGLQSGEQNAGYATLSCNGSVTYASNYKVPSDVQNNASLNAIDIRVTNTDPTESHYEYVSTEGYQKDAPLRGVQQPEYNLIEVLNTEMTDGTYEYIPTEGYQKDAPLRGVEQPEYNLIEVFNTDTTDDSYEYVPTEEYQKDVPLGSFDNHEYNFIENLDTRSADDGPAKTENALFSVEQRVYNLIEDLDTGILQDTRDDHPRE